MITGIEIAGGVLMMILSLAICLFVLLQESTRGGGIAAITGNEPDSFFNKSPGRTRNMMLYRATRLCAIIFFIITIGVHAASIHLR